MGKDEEPPGLFDGERETVRQEIRRDLDRVLYDRYDEAPGGSAALEAAFRDFHYDNPEVYRELVALARLAASRGRKRYGIAALFEILRWKRNVETHSMDEFKLNNNHRAYYARLIMKQEPDLFEFFETREAGVEGQE